MTYRHNIPASCWPPVLSPANGQSRIKRAIPACSIAIILLILIATSYAQAANYYVSNDGNDRNSGTSWENAWRTLIYAGSQAKAGDTVIVRSGEQAYLHLPVRTSGTRQFPILFKGEDPDNPPLISARIPEDKWKASTLPGIWTVGTGGQVKKLKINNLEIKQATSRACEDGAWYWENNTLYLRDAADNKDTDWIWVDKGGGIDIGSHSWISIENFRVWGGMGAGISIRGGSNNVINKVDVKWHWRGINIFNGQNNLVTDVVIHENREGIYLAEGSSNNLVSDCSVAGNGNLPFWDSGDRHAVAIGGNGPNTANRVEKCEIAFNGGPPDAVALIAFEAPETVFHANHVHHNYGSGVLATIKSDNTVITGNRIENNGRNAVVDGQKGIFALGVRGSRGANLADNVLLDNWVSPGSLWSSRDREPRGAIDIRRAGPSEDMSNIIVRNNRVYGTKGGPDLHVSRALKPEDLTVIPFSK